MRAAWRGFPGTLLTLVLLAIAGTSVTLYILIHQRLPTPFTDAYTIKAELPSADGVTPGSGQPVKVSGVPVGVISGLELQGGIAVVTLRIDRDELPAVYANAAATLRPISPLKDLQVDLDPGTPAAGELSDDRIGLERGAAPTDIDELLGALDGDTRDYLSSLINSVGAGTAGQGANMSQALAALAPTTRQVREITTAMAARRREVSRLVSNLSIVTRSATQDGRLAELVTAGNATLGAVAAEEEPLRDAITELPDATAAIDAALPRAGALADELVPTVDALRPAVRNFVPALRAARPFSLEAADTLKTDIRPFLRDAPPVLTDTANAVGDLRATTPDLDTVTRTLTYLVNEFVYNPPGDNEGLLFWIPWAGHNLNSTTSTADANGTLARATIFISCALPQGLPGVGSLLADALGATPFCPAGGNAKKGARR